MGTPVKLFFRRDIPSIFPLMFFAFSKIKGREYGMIMSIFSEDVVCIGAECYQEIKESCSDVGSI